MVKEKREKGPREIVGGESNPKVEHSYVCFPGQEMTDVTLHSTPEYVIEDEERLRELYSTYESRYRSVHTHRQDEFPSSGDFKKFLGNDKIKSLVIFNKTRNGKVNGCLFLRKRTHNPSPDYSQFKQGLEGREIDLEGNREHYQSQVDIHAGIYDMMRGYHNYRGKEQIKQLKKFCDKFNLQYRFVPAKDYRFDENYPRFRHRSKVLEFLARPFRRERTLEQHIASWVAILSFLFAIYFSSPLVTGNYMADFNFGEGNVLAFILFIFGIAASLFYLKHREPTKKDSLTKLSH